MLRISVTNEEPNFEIRVRRIGDAMNVQIIYDSKTGHTKKLAEAMAKKLGIEAVKFAPGVKVENVDLLFIGSGIYGSKFTDEFNAFLKTLDQKSVKRAALFITNLPGKLHDLPIVEILKSKKIVVEKEVYVCKGQFLFFSRKHPNAEDLKGAATFAERVLKAQSAE